MKKILCVMGLLFATVLSSFAQVEKIVGDWTTVDDNSGKKVSIVRIYKENGAYFGKIIKLLDPSANPKSLGEMVIRDMKEKKGHLTRKTAQTVTLADVHNLQETPEKVCPDHTKGLVEELRLLSICKGTKAMVLVDYDRTPFVCPSGNTRITLDENLRTLPYHKNIFASSHAMTPALDPDQVILEVKFDDYLPGYLSNVLADIPKAPMAISKFALCLNLI